MGKNSRLKKDRKIIREKVNKLFEEALAEKDEDKFFEKLGIIQSFDYLVQNDSKTENNFMHKEIFNELQKSVVDKIMNPGLQEREGAFKIFLEEKKIPEDIEMKELALFALYLSKEILKIKDKENYKEITNKLNDNETVDKILEMKKENKELDEFEDDEKKIVYDYIADVNKLIEFINDEIIEIGDKVVKASEKFKKREDEMSFAEIIYSSYIVAYNNNCFIPAVKEVEEYNNVLKVLKFGEEKKNG